MKKISFKKIDTKDAMRKAPAFAAKNEKKILAGLLLAGIIYFGYLWYFYDYHYAWDDAKKQQYMVTKSAGTTFNKDKFNAVLKNIKARQDAYQKNSDDSSLSDIFRLK